MMEAPVATASLEEKRQLPCSFLQDFKEKCVFAGQMKEDLDYTQHIHSVSALCQPLCPVLLYSLPYLILTMTYIYINILKL